MSLQFYAGCDPEIFVAKDGAVKSIIGLLGGTKDCPMPLPIGDGFMVQEDNVALEFNIPPSGSKEEFVSNIVKATTYLEGHVGHLYNFKFHKESAVSFPEEELSDPRAFVFGCDPDFNAWTGKPNPRPKADDKALRSCGGHVHIGSSHLGLDRRAVIRACDLFLGVPSVLMDDGELRKQLYGKAGAFRPKSYGQEYRTLSNFWVFDDKLMSWVWDSVTLALDAVSNKFDVEAEQLNIIKAINKNCKKTAQGLVDKYGLLVV